MMTDLQDSLFAELMLWLMYVALAAAAGATLYSMAHSLRYRSADGAVSNGVPRRRIGWGVAIGLVLLLAVTYLLGSTEPLTAGGTVFSDPFWLKVTDMLTVSAMVLMAVAALLVLYGISGLNRKISSHRKSS